MPEASLTISRQENVPKRKAYWLAALRLRWAERDAPMPTVRALSPGVAATACPRKLTLLRWVSLAISGP